MAWGFVKQTAYTDANAEVTTIPLSYTVSAGSDTVIVSCNMWGESSSAPTATIAGLGATWTLNVSLSDAGNRLSTYSWTGVGATTGAGTVTVTPSVTCYWSANISEWTGGSATVDGGSTVGFNSADSGGPASPAISPPTNGDLIIAQVNPSTTAYITLSGDATFTALTGDADAGNNCALALSYVIQATHSSISYTPNSSTGASATDSWIIYALKAATVAAVKPIPVLIDPAILILQQQGLDSVFYPYPFTPGPVPLALSGTCSAVSDPGTYANASESISGTSAGSSTAVLLDIQQVTGTASAFSDPGTNAATTITMPSASASNANIYATLGVNVVLPLPVVDDVFLYVLQPVPVPPTFNYPTGAAAGNASVYGTLNVDSTGISAGRSTINVNINIALTGTSKSSDKGVNGYLDLELGGPYGGGSYDGINAYDSTQQYDTPLGNPAEIDAVSAENASVVIDFVGSVTHGHSAANVTVTNLSQIIGESDGQSSAHATMVLSTGLIGTVSASSSEFTTSSNVFISGTTSSVTTESGTLDEVIFSNIVSAGTSSAYGTISFVAPGTSFAYQQPVLEDLIPYFTQPVPPYFAPTPLTTALVGETDALGGARAIVTVTLSGTVAGNTSANATVTYGASVGTASAFSTEHASLGEQISSESDSLSKANATIEVQLLAFVSASSSASFSANTTLTSTAFGQSAGDNATVTIAASIIGEADGVSTANATVTGSFSIGIAGRSAGFSGVYATLYSDVIGTTSSVSTDYGNLSIPFIGTSTGSAYANATTIYYITATASGLTVIFSSTEVPQFIIKAQSRSFTVYAVARGS